MIRRDEIDRRLAAIETTLARLTEIIGGDSDLVTTKEAAAILGRTEHAVRHLAHRGIIGCTHTDTGRLRFRRGDLREFRRQP